MHKGSNRRTIRLRDYNYSLPGDYFITVCTKGKRCLFGYIIDGKMIPNHLGRTIEKEILNMPQRFRDVNVDIYSVMPNHVHMILSILCNNNVGATLAVARGQDRAGASPAPTIGDIVGSFKSLCFKKHREYILSNGFDVEIDFWQRNYYEHIIRNEKAYNEIYAYIESNSQIWERDSNNQTNL